MKKFNYCKESSYKIMKKEYCHGKMSIRYEQHMPQKMTNKH